MIAPTLHDIPQRSEEWFRKRAGSLTGSRAQAMLAKTRGGSMSKMRQRLITDLALERLLGVSEKSAFVTPDMQHGIDQEPHAIAAYEALHMQRVATTGYVEHPTIAWVGCSPDGLLGEDGMLEIKCPASHTHMSVLRNAKTPTTVLAQLRHNLFVTGRDWIDYVSFDPRFPDNAQVFIERWSKEALEMEEYRVQVEAFLQEVANEVKLVKEYTHNV